MSGPYTELVSLEEVKAELRITGSGEDDALQLYIDAVSTFIQRSCSRGFGKSQAAETRLYDGSGRRTLRTGELVSVSALEVAPGEGAAFVNVPVGKFFLLPTEADQKNAIGLAIDAPVTVFHRGYGTVKITGIFGYADVPADIRSAALLTVTQLRKAKKAGQSGEVGPTEYPAVASKDIPKMAQLIIQSYRRMRAGSSAGGR